MGEMCANMEWFPFVQRRRRCRDPSFIPGDARSFWLRSVAVVESQQTTEAFSALHRADADPPGSVSFTHESPPQ